MVRSLLCCAICVLFFAISVESTKDLLCKLFNKHCPTDTKPVSKPIYVIYRKSNFNNENENSNVVIIKNENENSDLVIPKFEVVEKKNVKKRYTNLDDINSANSEFSKLPAPQEYKELIKTGTKWCTGSWSNYTDFGMYKNSDKCCRDLSFCPYSKEEENETIYHCKCIKKMQSCLTDTNSKISTILPKLLWKGKSETKCYDYVHECILDTDTKVCTYDKSTPPRWTVIYPEITYE